MNRKISVKDYPEHLNPFDDKYNGEAEPINSRQKYNTWSASRPNQVSTLARPKPKPTFLEKPWAALNLSPKGKVVRKLSMLKTAVERFASRKRRLTHSTSYSEDRHTKTPPPRSHSVHEEFSFRIISPKLKEKIRQQAFSRSLSKQDQPEEDPTASGESPQVNDRLYLPLKLDVDDSPSSSPGTPNSCTEVTPLGVRPKTRKKRPPPPPPTSSPLSANKVFGNERQKSDDSHSANSSITQDLEKDASSDEDISVAELDHSLRVKPSENKG